MVWDVRHLTNMQTSINTRRVFWYNLAFKKVCYKHSAKQPAVLGRTFGEWCEIVIVTILQSASWTIHHLSVCFCSHCLILWECFCCFVHCTLTLCQVFCHSSSEVFLMTYHGFNYGVIIFCLGGFWVLGPALNTWGFILLSRALWSGA